MQKSSSSQAAWALLTEGVSQARLDAHRIQHLLTRCLKLVDQSPQKDHLYQVAGDIIMAFPPRLEHLELMLDRTSLALSKMGETFLEANLPLSEKTLVEESLDPAFNAPRHSLASRVAQRYLARVTDEEG
jgi:hypothetical protein